VGPVSDKGDTGPKGEKGDRGGSGLPGIPGANGMQVCINMYLLVSERFLIKAEGDYGNLLAV
jgi:hypothetical protein